MAAPFIIFSLPRSRTAWLSAYLSYEGAVVWHDTAIYCEKPEDFAANFANGMAGCVETGAIIGWKAIRALLPDAKFLAITRPTSEIRASLARVGLTPLDGELEHRRVRLNEMVEAEECPCYAFEDLEKPKARSEVFEYCLGKPFDAAWDRKMDAVNVQIDIPARVATLIRNREKIETLKSLMVPA